MLEVSSSEINIALEPIVAVLLHDESGRFLLTQRAESVRNEAGKWSVPAGHIENGESIVDAASREVFEETALDICGINLVDLGSTKIEKLRMIVYLMCGKYPDFKGVALNTQELQKMKLLFIDEFVDDYSKNCSLYTDGAGAAIKLIGSALVGSLINSAKS